jgi:hypothetical protein
LIPIEDKESLRENSSSNNGENVKDESSDYISSDEEMEKTNEFDIPNKDYDQDLLNDTNLHISEFHRSMKFK